MGEVRRAFCALAAFLLASPALAQEPDHLERLAGVCRDESDAVIGAYAGRVLWMQDGQLSGMLTRDDDAEPVEGEALRADVSPRTMSVPRQTPEQSEGGLVLRTRVVALGADGGDLDEVAVACTVNPVAAGRSDPGATSRG